MRAQLQQSCQNPGFREVSGLIYPVSQLEQQTFFVKQGQLGPGALVDLESQCVSADVDTGK